jgi:hypothetical protein
MKQLDGQLPTDVASLVKIASTAGKAGESEDDTHS